ncbi:hypothetical protein CLV35_3185 [Motilibacter peucedani]|uniref:Peptide subunit release factor 1 (ERF1) n=1 Tax=Motilibacter peucedani TaxID=598650 RepID=A0A420XM54_9ACTN|nr:Vms1/Ankzf1 family peptidyl-tRNA hydrolase [Motilibacter peucedani]RKS71388.1 hypothetical protein CLV35_3185 [Motilibacter peucedani]
MTRLSQLRPLYEAEGPFATAYLDATRSTETGAHEVELRWAAIKDQLRAAGAPAGALEAMEPVALAPTRLAGDATLVLVADEQGLRYTSVLPVRAPERAAFGALPDLAPLVVALGRTAPYVLVRIDREGADIDVVGPTGETREHETVSGGEENLHKTGAGDWAALKYEHRTDNLWDANAARVAHEVDAILARTGIEVLAVAGDVKAAERFRDSLGQHGQRAFVALGTGGRAEGTDEQALQEELGRVLAAHVVRDAEDPVSRYRQQTGAGHGAALSGRAAVVEALQKAQVDTLLVTAGFEDESPLWVGPDPVQVASSQQALQDMGVEQVREVRADAALLRAAVGSDAGVVVVPGGRLDLRDGVGALLRYADASTS